MTGKQVRAQYTQEFKMEAVRQVSGGRAVSVMAKVLGIPKASLGCWVRQSAKGELNTAADVNKAPKVTLDQMEIARLRVEARRLRMERDIEKKPQRTSHRTLCDVRLDSPNEKATEGQLRACGAVPQVGHGHHRCSSSLRPA